MNNPNRYIDYIVVIYFAAVSSLRRVPRKIREKNLVDMQTVAPAHKKSFFFFVPIQILKNYKTKDTRLHQTKKNFGSNWIDSFGHHFYQAC